MSPRVDRRRRWQISGAVEKVATSEEAPQPPLLAEMARSLVGVEAACCEDYDVVKQLGSGAQGTVNLVKSTKHSDNGESKYHAMKVIHLNSDTDPDTSLKRLKSEIAILKSRQSEFLITSDAIYTHAPKHELHIIMEYMDCGTLADVVKHATAPITEDIAAIILYQVVHGLKSLHQGHGGTSYMHRDLKPDNILLSWNGQCKLADFGLAKQITSRNTMQSRVGNYAFMAPERLNPCIGTYGTPSDMWSAGMVLLTLLNGGYPISYKTQFQLVSILCKFDYDSPTEAWSRPDAEPVTHEFLSSILTVAPSDRLTAPAALDHPFLLPIVDQDAARGVLQAWLSDHGKSLPRPAEV